VCYVQCVMFGVQCTWKCFNDAASKILECFDAGNKEAAIAEYNKFALSQGKPTIKAFLNKMKF
jgi:hypothetical protein